MSQSYITVNGQFPGNVMAGITCRRGGVSQAPFDTNNLALHVGDKVEHVIENRKRIAQAIGIAAENFFWLDQVHGIDVAEAPFNHTVRADAVFTSKPNAVCCIMTADCLPVLLSNSQGTEVAAIHAGWRSLASGVIEHTIEKMQSDAGELTAYLGPAISQKYFEVGGEVKAAFCQQHKEAECAFKPSDNTGKYMADLYRLAALRLNSSGVKQVSTIDACTFAEKEKWYSYRRDGETGRMLSFIYIKG